jgi:perosamine synthetase
VIDQFEQLVKSIYREETVTLHRPVFAGNEKQYLVDCIDSNFVSSVGARVTEFEQKIATFTGAKYAVATVNGTAALHIALIMAGVDAQCEVISQALTFIATCNALAYTGAQPVFIDVDKDTMGMSPVALKQFLDAHAEIRSGQTFNKTTGKRIAACVPMHTFGLPCRIEEIMEICNAYGIAVVEDAAESLGSYVSTAKGLQHTGTFGLLGTLSFNGNKVITTGGGGMLITNDAAIAARAKHLTTTAKKPHPFEFVHDAIGYNYRLPNLNAALGCAQMEQLPYFLEQKNKLARRYATFFENTQFTLAHPVGSDISNYWLNAIVLNSLNERNAFLERTNAHGVMTRPIWRMMSSLDMFKHCQRDSLAHSHWLEERVVNIPSSVPNHPV